MHHRKSPRATRIDYSASAAFFVTICTKDRVNYFGEICRDGFETHPTMKLNDLGLYITEHRNHIADHYPFVRTDVFVCMPNHVHGILIIGEHDNLLNIQLSTVGTQFLASGNDDIASIRTDKNPSLPASCASGSIIRGFKIGITKYANQHNIPFARQSRYHDHLIRNDAEFERIQYYIQTNPQNRDKDSLA